MFYREAVIADIPQLFEVRMSVKENILVSASLVTVDICKEYLTVRGKGWVCEEDGVIFGFAIADINDDNIWALFVRPENEGIGIGRRLHEIMLDWYFSQGKENVWLSTSPGTRAERFYRKIGWRDTSITGNNEIRFELTAVDWCKFRSL